MFLVTAAAAQKKNAGLSILHRLVRLQTEGADGLPRPEVLPTQKRSTTMRVMVMVKATKNSEAGAMPSEKLLADMGKFNEELVKAGIMLAGEGLQPSSKGKRVRFSAGRKAVSDGPFSETKELVAGFWIWQVKSM